MAENIINDGKNPNLAEALYNSYQHDGIPFVMSTLDKLMNDVSSQYPDSGDEERKKMRQVLKLEIVMKFCHYAENLAAISISFTRNYNSSDEEALGLFETMNKYNVDKAIDFFEKISERKPEYLAKFLGYPPLSVQNSQALEVFKRSCNIAKDEFEKIAHHYLNFRQLYNAYKHGYRVFFGTTQTADDGYAFMYKGKQKLIVISNDTLDDLKRSTRHIERLMKIIFLNHIERKRFEESDKRNVKVNLQFLRKPNDPPHDPNIKIMFTKRGERRQKETEERDMIYKKFQPVLETKHLNKIAVIDLDEKEIVGIADTGEDAVKIMHESTSSGRKSIRKIGFDDRTGLEYY